MQRGPCLGSLNRGGRDGSEGIRKGSQAGFGSGRALLRLGGPCFFPSIYRGKWGGSPTSKTL